MRRLFFGMSIGAPWPKDLPEGRMIAPQYRHITLAFLGHVEYEPLKNVLPNLPIPNFSIAPVGLCDEFLFFPKHHPKVVVWQATQLGQNKLAVYQKTLTDFLRAHEYKLDRRVFLPHITIARQPFKLGQWKKCFQALPFYCPSVCLYESVGQLRYEVLWQQRLTPPFKKIMAEDYIEFQIYGENMLEVCLNAQCALAFEYPKHLDLLEMHTIPEDFESLAKKLNAFILKLKKAQALPFNSISVQTNAEGETHLKIFAQS